MAESPFIANVAEFFTLQTAAKTVDSVGDGSRRRIHDALLLGRQKATCAETLWANGHTAEGLALAAGALEATLAAAPALSKNEAAKAEEAKAEEADEAGAEPTWQDVLGTRGVSKADLEIIRSASQRSREALPALDRDVSPAHAELFLDLARARQRADRALAAGALTHRDLRWTRVLRGLGAALVGVRRPTGTFATASDFFQQSPQFAPENAIDGSPATYWLLPDGATGWLEVTTSPARHVGRVRVLNTTNPPWADRGTNEYRIEVYVHGEVAQTIDGAFSWSDAPTPVDHPIDLDDVERVRFVVRSHHRNGAGLAELQLD